MTIFEGKKPLAKLTPLPEYISQGITFNVVISDVKMGLRDVKVSIKQDGPAIHLLKKIFPIQDYSTKRESIYLMGNLH